MRRLIIVAGVAAAVFSPRFASAAIIKLRDLQTCNAGANGLDTSTSSVRGGVHCDNGNPLSLSDILDGTIALLVGDSQTPSWNVINDTGAAVTSLSLYFSGALASNSFIDMQISGTNIFTACTATTAANIVTTAANCGSSDKTADNPALPLLLVWSGGTGLAVDQTFNIATASFAHAGEDQGCISGSCNPVPDTGYTLTLFGLGLFGIAIGTRRWVTRDEATPR